MTFGKNPQPLPPGNQEVLLFQRGEQFKALVDLTGLTAAEYVATRYANGAALVARTIRQPASWDRWRTARQTT